MKKFLMYILCIVCVFTFCNLGSVSAIEGENPEETQPSEGEVEGGNSEGESEEENTPSQNPDDNESKETENPEKEIESTPTEDKTTTEPKTNTKANDTVKASDSAKPKKETYSYSSKNTTKKKSVNVKIYNIDASTGKGLKDSKLQIQDKDGKVIKKWTSTSDAYVIDDLDRGTYYVIVEKVADGYKADYEKIEFVVDYSDNDVEVKIENSVVVEEPVVLNSGSILLLSMAMVDISIGLWIFIYVKRNKIKE